MKEKINVFDYAERIAKTLPEGILLNTKHEKFNLAQKSKLNDR